MDVRIQKLIDETKVKFGLEDYYLKRYHFHRFVNLFNETVYRFCMEWFPNHVREHEDDHSNPEGTAVIEVNLNTGKFENVIFVMGKTYAKGGVVFSSINVNEMIKWIEQETGLIYGKQFQLQKEEEGEFLFQECFEGVAVSPAGFIEIEINQEGQLLSFAVSGQFPTQEMVRVETYQLSFEKIEHLAKDQLKLIEFPSIEKKKIFPIYAVEEIYFTNDGKSTIPFEEVVHEKSLLEVNKVMEWDEPLNSSYERKEIHWQEDISAEQAFSLEPSPDVFPISKAEQEKCVKAVQDFLRQEYSKDTGKWVLKTLHREKGYIHATLEQKEQEQDVFQRKLKIIIDGKMMQAVNDFDNISLLEIYHQFEAPDQVSLSKEGAYETLKKWFELKPVYVYDYKQKQYILCGKFDCQYGVNAANGDIIALDDL